MGLVRGLLGDGGRGQAQAQRTAGGILADTSINVGNNQAYNAVQAAEMEAAAFEQAGNIIASGTGGYSSVVGNVSNQAISDLQDASQSYISGVQGASDTAIAGFQAAGESALSAQQQGFSNIQNLLMPFTQIGDASATAIQNAATPEGFAARLADIMDGDVFEDLRSNRLQAADARLSSAGLNRSGYAAQEASDITASTALGLDSEIYQRQLNNVQIDQAASTALAGFNQQNSDRISQIEFDTADRVGQTGLNTANAIGQIGFNTASQVGDYRLSAANAQDRAAASAASARNSASRARADAVINAASAQANGLRESAYFEGAGHSGAAQANANALVGSQNARDQGRQNRLNAGLGIISAASGIFG